MWQCGLWPLRLWVSCRPRSLLGGVMSTCLPHCCGWCTSSISCFRKSSRMRCFLYYPFLWGGMLFHAHLSLAFFFWSFAFLGSAFLVVSFFPVGFGLVFLTVVPQHSFFNELISTIMAMIFSCSSVGLPQVFSSSRSQASYLFSAWTMRSSAMKVAQPSSH